MKASAVIAVAMLCSSTAWAQSNPPMVGDKPLVQVKPKAAPKAAPKGAAQDTTTETDDAAAAPKTAAPKTAAAAMSRRCRCRRRNRSSNWPA